MFDASLTVFSLLFPNLLFGQFSSWCSHFQLSSLHLTYMLCQSVFQTDEDTCCILLYLPGHQTRKWALLLRWRGRLGHQEAASMHHSQRTSGRMTARVKGENTKKKESFYSSSSKPAAVHIHGFSASNPSLYAAMDKFAHWKPQMAVRAKWGSYGQCLVG